MIKASAFVGASNTTGQVDFGLIEEVALRYFPDGITLSKTEGIWDGGREHSCCVSRVGEDDLRARWYDFAREVKSVCAQNSVLLEFHQVQVEFV